MSDAKRSAVEVVIAGEVVVLQSEASEDFIHRVARYLDRKMTQIMREKKIISFNSFSKVLLIALNISEDLHKEIETGEKLKLEHAQLLTAYNLIREEFELVERAEMLAKKQINELMLRLGDAQSQAQQFSERLEANTKQNQAYAEAELEALVEAEQLRDTNRRLSEELERAKAEVATARRELDAGSQEYSGKAGNVYRLKK